MPPQLAAAISKKKGGSNPAIMAAAQNRLAEISAPKNGPVKKFGPKKKAVTNG